MSSSFFIVNAQKVQKKRKEIFDKIDAIDFNFKVCFSNVNEIFDKIHAIDFTVCFFVLKL